MSFLLFLQSAWTLVIKADGATFKVSGTPTSFVFTYDPANTKTMIVLVKPMPNQAQIEYDGVFLDTDGKYYDIHVKKGQTRINKDTKATGVPDINRVVYQGDQDVPTENFLPKFNQVYRVCIVNNGNMNTNTSDPSVMACGSYHTFQNSFYKSDNDMANRNLGILAKSEMRTGTIAGNNYNLSIYYGYEGNILTGTIFASVVITTKESVPTAWNAWSALGIGADGMIKQDIAGFDLTNKLHDMYSTATTASSVKDDNDTTVNKGTYNLVGIDGGRGNTYNFFMFSRQFVSTDLSYDKTVITKVTEVCAVMKDGIPGTLKSFDSQHSQPLCVTFNWASVLAVSLVWLMFG